MRHAAIDNGFRYWFALIRRMAGIYAGRRRPLAGLRALARIILTGWYFELCFDCGRRYPLWWCDDDALFRELSDQGVSGLLCIRCFDRRARRAGIDLDWRPQRFQRPGSETQP